MQWIIKTVEISITCLAPASLLAWGMCCALLDARQRRISNVLTLGCGAVATAFLIWTGHSFTGVTPGPVMLGLLLALLLSLPGYIGGRMGAGDVKLLAALALASSPLHVLGTVAGAAVAMLTWALAGPFIWRRLPPSSRYHLAMMDPANRNRLPYAPFFFCGLLASILWLH
ncbi:prepilin peptidase [Pseudomonas sp. FME51]|uniref:prepilin peptidase n=1 Tax=Pseudomonas sp. FME51 TaxID=2742609 RepID=UPI001868C4CC|nr:prepilin peptidase [Pseudomonas sp. FME51]